MFFAKKAWLFASLILLSSFPAAAHVTLAQREASPGAPYKAVFLVPHGCGESATIRLRVNIPEGVILVKPMAKPEWRIDVERAPYARPFASLHGAKLTEGVSAVTWSGLLPDAFYDEFVLTTFISSDLAAEGVLYFPVTQTCEKGEHRWIEIPQRSGDHVDEPAPGVKLVPRNPNDGERR
jgi:periplasmic copper chaperone A